MRVSIEYVSSSSTFTFKIGATSTSTINKITVTWTGRNASGTTVTGNKVFTPLSTTFNSSFGVNKMSPTK